MKTLLTVTIVFLLLSSCTSTRNINVCQREFVYEDSLKISSFRFINDSICVYTQEFAIDIGVQLQKTEIVCRYRIDKNRIILNAVESPEFIAGKTYYSLSDSIKDIYISKIVTKKWPLQVYNQQMDLADYYGHINGINTDTITYYKDDLLYIKCVYTKGFLMPIII